MLKLISKMARLNNCHDQVTLLLLYKFLMAEYLLK